MTMQKGHFRRKAALLLAALTASAALGFTASADFSKSTAYPDNLFTDLEKGSWYEASVKDVYEFGLMKGDSDTTFSPNGTLTAAEGITVAVRIHQVLHGTELPANDGEWYAPYVAYALQNGLMEKTMFSSMEQTITRAQMAELLADACGELPAVNTLDSIPDVAKSAPYAEKLLMLYRAGILTGNDDYGTFAPDSSLLRCEIAAMIVRVADSTKRVSKTFKDGARSYSDAYAIIDCPKMDGMMTGIANGWKYDNRFDLSNFSGYERPTFYDISDKAHTAIFRDFNAESEGLLTFETVFNAESDEGCAYIAFSDGSKNALKLSVKNGRLLLAGKTESATECDIKPSETGRFFVVFRLDLDKKTAYAVINGKKTDTVTLSGDTVSRITFGTEKKGTALFSVKYAMLNKNYPLNEHFLSLDGFDGKAPAEWTTKGTVTVEKILSQVGSDLFSAKMNASAGKAASAATSFNAVGGKFAFETFLLLPEKADGAAVMLTGAGNEVLKIGTSDGAFMAGDTKLHTYTGNVWQCLRVEGDLSAGTAVIKINGKERATVPVSAPFVDGVTVSFAPDKDAVLWFDDVSIAPVIEHDDYPAEPVSARDDGYNIGMNVCSLWRDNTAYEGWDAVSPFEEFTPYLGYYDDGLPETADWEIKWMVEHGIDFMHICWYAPYADTTAPIKKMRTSYSALHDGYMNARYSDRLDFCIMWENNYGDVGSFEQFKEYLWKYWKEYYFSDERYARLDNKAVLTIWDANRFNKSFANDGGSRKALAFMDKELKEMGYDGLILLFSAQNKVTDDLYKLYASYGVDTATYGYHWGRDGSSAAYQIDCNQTNLQKAQALGTHHIPTVSVGFNDIGRNDRRSDLITPEGHLSVCESMKKELSALHTGTWRDNTVFVSTWNEFSEGTYVFPTESTGFDYLENIRKTFTKNTTDHTALDVRPTEAQKARVCRTYVTASTPIRRYRFESDEVTSDTLSAEDMTVVCRYDMSEDGVLFWERSHGIEDYSTDGGVISGTAPGIDPGIKAVNFRGFSAEDAPIFHVRMKASVVCQAELFFLTNNDGTWNYDKVKLIDIQKAGEWVDLYADLSEMKTYKDRIVNLRFDPMTAPGTFEIALIEFLKPKDTAKKIPTITVNGTELAFSFKPTVAAGGDYEVVGEARGKGFYSALCLFYEYSRFDGDGKLTLHTPTDKTLVFRVGSDSVLVDGKEEKLGYTFTLRDGLPVFRIKKLAELLGYPCTEQNGVLNIQSADDEQAAQIAAMKPNQWEFDIPGYMGGWSVGNGQGFLSGGKLNVEPANGDPAISIDVNFEAEEYAYIVVGLVYDSKTMTNKYWSGIPQLFFGVNGGGVKAAQCFNGNYLSEGLKDGDIVEVAFDLSTKAEFKGTITRLRFDPFDGITDPFRVDYFRCLTKEEAKPYIDAQLKKAETAVPEKAVEVKHLTGSSEMPEGVTVSAPGYISINTVSDPDNRDKAVWSVYCNVDGNYYTYFNVYMNFKRGATYKITYRISPMLSRKQTEYTNAVISDNLIYGTDGINVKDHTRPSAANKNSNTGWQTVTCEYTIPENYIPSEDDCFQIWSKFTADGSSAFLVDDVTVEIK